MSLRVAKATGQNKVLGIRPIYPDTIPKINQTPTCSRLVWLLNISNTKHWVKMEQSTPELLKTGGKEF